MTAWFGESWGAPVCDPERHVETPVGALCHYCNEPIEEGDSGAIYTSGQALHRDCFIRQAVGGLNHVLGLCTCQGGTEPPDPPNMSRRAAATAAVQEFQRRHA